MELLTRERRTDELASGLVGWEDAGLESEGRMSGAEEVGDAWEGAVSTKKAIRKQVQQVDERSGKDSKVTSLPLKLLLHQLANEPRKCTLPMNPNEQEEVLRLFRHLVQMTLFNSRSRPPDSQPKLCRSERLHKLPSLTAFQRPRHGSLRASYFRFQVQQSLEATPSRQAVQGFHHVQDHPTPTCLSLGLR